MASTKLLIDFLNIKKTIPIKHHQRLISGFISRYSFKNRMDFLNSFIWFKGKNNGFNFNGDLRIGSNIIMNAITRKYPIVKIDTYY